MFFSSFPNAVGDQRESEVAIENSLADLERLLKTQSMPSETAAMLIEPVLGEGGYLPVPPGFLKGLREICDRTGILLIVDEIQRAPRPRPAPRAAGCSGRGARLGGASPGPIPILCPRSVGRFWPQACNQNHRFKFARPKCNYINTSTGNFTSHSMS